MKLLRQIIGFFKALGRKPKATGTVEDSPEMEVEKELKRGMRGL